LSEVFYVYYLSTEIVFEVKFSTEESSCSVSVAHQGRLQNIIIIKTNFVALISTFPGM